MKKYFMLIVTVIATSLIFWSCGSDDGTTEPTNQSPTCTIASPAPYTGFFNGDTISVRISVDDPDGDIKEVRYFLNGLGEYSTQTFPYSAEILTSGLPLGENLIKVVVEDDDGAKTEVELPFGIKPKNPSNLLITQNNVYTFTLNWTGNDENADGFKIERKIDDGSFSEISTTTATTYIDSTVAKKGYGTVYYQVRAYKDIYNSDYVSNNFAVSFPAPTNLTYTKINLNTIRLNWLESSNGEDGLKIDKKVGNNDWAIAYGSVIENTVSWTDSLAEINEDLQYRVYGYKGLNTSESVETAIISNEFPAPTNFSVTQSSLTTATVSFTDNSIGEDKFEIERKISTESSYTIIAEIFGSDTSSKSWVDSTTVPNLIYDYRIRGVKSSDASIYATKTGFNNLFRAPTSFTVVQNNVHTFTLNWTDSNIGEDGFKIERKIDDGAFTEIATITGTNYVDDTVAKKGFGTVYYQIRAYKDSYYSNYSTAESEVSFPAPTNLEHYKEATDIIKLTWEDNSVGEQGFKIDKKIGAGEWHVSYALLPENTVTWTDENAEVNQTLTYKVYAYKGNNSSNSLTTPIIDNTLPAPTNLTAAVASESSIKLDWAYEMSGIDGFLIDCKIGATGEWITHVDSLGPNIYTYTETGLTTGTTYYYRVRSCYSDNYSNYSNVSADTPGIVGFIEIPTGSFNMGGMDYSDEQPIHPVNITRPYYIGKYEVTQSEWTAYMPDGTYNYGSGAAYPVYYVSWYEIIKYCNLRSMAEGLTPCYTISSSTDPATWGTVPTSTNTTWNAVICNWSAKGYRLPSEAEWEYAARYNDGRTYPWGGTFPSNTLCNYNSIANAVNATTAVGSYPSGNSSLGLCDMAGNVWEWVWDWYATYPSTVQTDPSGPTTAQTDRLLRGGSWTVYWYGVKCAYRNENSPSKEYYTHGFRLARSK